MKLGKSALLEVMALVLEGLATNTDISAKLREMDLEIPEGETTLELTAEYTKNHPRADEWDKN